MNRWLFCVLLAIWVSTPALAVEYKPYPVAANARVEQAEALAAEGDHDQALALYQQAMEAYAAASQEQGVLMCLERMGWLNREIGRYGQALELFRRAYPLAERLNGDAAEIDADLGDVALFSGDPDKARQHYEKTLTTLAGFVFPVSYGRPPSQEVISPLVRKSKAIIHARVNLGTMHYFARNYDSALAQLTAADELIGRVWTVANHFLYGMFFKPDPDFLEGVGFCQTMFGATYGEMGRFEQAWKHFDAAQKAFEKGKRYYGLLVQQALRYKIEFLSPDARVDESRLPEYDRFLERVERFGAPDIVWRMSYEIGQALARRQLPEEAATYLARAIAALEQTRSQLREDTVKMMFAASVQDVYGAMIRLCYRQQRLAEGFDYLERAKARAFLDMLAGRSVKAKESVDPELVRNAADLQTQIEVLGRRLQHMDDSRRDQAFATYRDLMARRADVLEEIKRQSLEFAATTTVATVAADRIAARLDNDTALLSFFSDAEGLLIWSVRGQTIEAAKSDVPAQSLAGLVADYREAIASQQNQLAAELGAGLAKALLEPVKARIAGVSRLILVPAGPLHYLPFACLPLADQRPLIVHCALTVLPNGSSLFLLDKQVAADQTTLLAIGDPARPKPGMALPFARDEVGVIARDFARAQVRTGDQATESFLKTQDWRGTGIIHLAAHGTYDARHPLQSALLLAPDQANDGNLEMHEIFSLTLNPRLVVLSACQSGLGKAGGGDEVQGLNRAFLYAGAAGVVASLWNVADQSTFALMSHFYANLAQRPVAEALRQAQLKLMEQYPSAYHWAAFYLTGAVGL